MKKESRIAHILPFTHVGGTELATLRIAEAIDNDGFEHVAFCRREASAVRDLFAARGFAVYDWDPVEPSYRRPGAFLRASRELAKALRQSGAALVHCADYLAAHYTAIGASLAGLPVLCHVRNRHADISMRDRTFIMPVDRFVFVSKQTWREFGIFVPEGKGTVVYDGIDVRRQLGCPEERANGVSYIRKEFGISETAPLVGMVARVAPQKDYATLIKAAALTAKSLPDIRFLLIGDYEATELNREHYEQVRRWIEEHRVADRFIFTGYRTDVDRLVSALDVFVLTTHHEGLPLVILEAMAHAKPVLATAVDGVPEVVVDGKTGYLHNHEDAAALASHLEQLFADPRHVIEMGAAGRKHAQEHFSREMFRAGMTDVYMKMLNRSANATGVVQS